MKFVFDLPLTERRHDLKSKHRFQEGFGICHIDTDPRDTFASFQSVRIVGNY